MATAVAQFTTKTTNSERAIKFLSLESPIKSHMLFTNKKNLCFPILRRKKIVAPGNGGGGGGLLPCCQYSICTKFYVKWTKIFLDTACFFTAGLLAPNPPQTALRFPKTPSPGMVNHILSTTVLLLNNLHFSLYALNERVF